MDTKTVLPSSVHGAITAQPSKSMAQRALIIALLTDGECSIYNIGKSDDVRHVLGAITQFGAKVIEKSTHVKIQGVKELKPAKVNCGESGLAMRTLSMVSLACEGTVHLTCEGSLISRPKSQIISAVESIGGKAELFSDGSITVSGPNRHNIVKINANTTSQVLSGLLLASPKLGGLRAEVINLNSKPYVDATISLMNHFGVDVNRRRYEVFNIEAKEKYEPRFYTVEGDWSGVANMLVAGALAGSVTVKGLSQQSHQPDKRILSVLRNVGADVQMVGDQVTVNKCRLEPFSIDVTDCPDLAPPLVALASHCNGISKITGVHRLRSKESDRAEALLTEFRKLGVNITVHNDDIIIMGGSYRGGMADSNGDHRIAMAIATAALLGKFPTELTGASCVNKSYPTFWEDFSTLSVNEPVTH